MAEFFAVAGSDFARFPQCVALARGAFATFLDFLPKKLGGFARICCEASLFCFSKDTWVCCVVYRGPVLLLPMRGFWPRRLLAESVDPSRDFRMFRVVFADWVLAVASTSFLPYMVIFLSWKDFEGTFTLWPVTATL